MSDRDFILQEIRKIFKEAQNSADPAQEKDKLEPEAEKTQEKPGTAKPTAPEKQGVVLDANSKPPEGYSFQKAQVPAEYADAYAKITPGMDRVDTGDCGFLNQAAVGILGTDDPKYIYTALVNSGVIPANFQFKPEPCTDLGRLIGIFQSRAVQNKLWFQDKIDPKGNITKGLEYKPKIPTKDISKRPDVDVSDKPVLAKKTPAVPAAAIAESPQTVAVDGKIGSRTAKLLKIYAEPNNFIKIVPKPGPAPAPKPSPEAPKAKKGCDELIFRSKQEFEDKTAMAMMGYHYCQLDRRFAAGQIRNRNLFQEFSKALLSGDAGESTDAFRNSIKMAQELKKDLGNKMVDFHQDAVNQDKSQNQVYNKKYPYMYEVLNNSFGSRVVKMYSGFYGNRKIVYFSFVKASSEGKNKPLIYSVPGTRDSKLDDMRAFITALGYNKWIFKKTEDERLATIPDYDKKLVAEMIGYASKHIKSLNHYYRAGIPKALNASQQIEAGSDMKAAAGEGKNMLQNYMRILRDFASDLQEFIGAPNEETLTKLARSAGIISLCQREAWSPGS